MHIQVLIILIGKTKHSKSRTPEQIQNHALSGINIERHVYFESGDVYGC